MVSREKCEKMKVWWSAEIFLKTCFNVLRTKEKKEKKIKGKIFTFFTSEKENKRLQAVEKKEFKEFGVFFLHSDLVFSIKRKLFIDEIIKWRGENGIKVEFS